MTYNTSFSPTIRERASDRIREVHDSSTVQIDQNLNPPLTRIEILDFTKSNWPKLKESLNTIDWPTTFCGTLVNVYIDVAIDIISEKIYYVCSTKKQSQKK